MGIFICCECDNYADSDTGCEECLKHEKDFGLISIDCLSNMSEEEHLGLTGKEV